MESSSNSARAIAVTRGTAQGSGPASWDAIREIARPWLRGSRLYWLAGAVLALAGVALGWNWLVAAGVLPILLSVLPCVAMCAVGLCAMKGAKSCGEKTAKDGAAGRPVTQMPEGDL